MELLRHEAREGLLGAYMLAGEQAFGKLRIEPDRSIELSLRYEKSLNNQAVPSKLHGVLHDLRKISCLNCVSGSEQYRWNSNGGQHHSVVTTPHHVLVGQRHFDPDRDKVRTLSFRTTDIEELFNDFDSFGVIDGDASFKHSLFPKKIGDRNVRFGPSPIVCYFSGETSIAKAKAESFTFGVNHWVGHEYGSTSGIAIKSTIMATLTFNQTQHFNDAMHVFHSTLRFLGSVAGRPQAVDRISIEIEADALDRYFECLLSFSPTGPSEWLLKQEEPSWRDMPLDAIRRPEEFSTVFEDWMRRDEKWLAARVRYRGCMEEENRYGIERLVAAANMFDLLPEEDTFIAAKLSPELEDARKRCKEIMTALPQSQDRDSVLNALGRVGKPSLTKKVIHRASIVSSQLDVRFPRLEEVAKAAVQLRNYYVHGSAKNASHLREHSVFLTQTLEFIFVASDLIQAGWDARRWDSFHHTADHWFVRYRHAYTSDMTSLLEVSTSRESSS